MFKSKWWMKLLVTILIVTLAVRGVEVLTDRDLENPNMLLVAYYLPWNEESSTLIDQLDMVKQKWAGGRVGKLDLSEYPLVGTKENVFSSLKLRKYSTAGVYEDYTGKLEEASILAWIEGHDSTNADPLNDNIYTSKEQNDYLKESYDGLGSSNHQNSEYSEYTPNSAGHSNKPPQASEDNLSNDNKKESSYTYTYSTSSKSIPEGKVIEFEGNEALQTVVGNEKPALILFSDHPEKDGYDQFVLSAESTTDETIFSHARVSSGMGEKVSRTPRSEN